MIQDRSPPPDGGYGWIIIFASTLINSTLAPLMQCFGIIYNDKFKEMGISAAEVSFLLHFNSSIMCSLGFVSGPLLKKFDYRQMTFCGCLFVCTGIIATAFAQSYMHLLFSTCILIGVGQGIIMPSLTLAANTYFKKKITLAMSYSITGVGLLPIIMPQICVFLLDSYGIFGTVFSLAGIALHSLAGSLLLRPIKNSKRKKIHVSDAAESNKSDLLLGESRENRENSSKIELDDNENVADEDIEEEMQLTSLQNEVLAPTYSETIQKTTIRKKLFWLFNLELFNTKHFIILVLGMSFSYISELNFILMTPFVLSELSNFSSKQIANAMSVQAAADIFGRLIIPIISHKTKANPKWMYAASLVGSCFGRTMLAAFCFSKSMVLTSFIILGLAKGSKAVFQALILPKYVSLDQLASAFGFLMVLNGILSLIIGPAIGFIHDISHSYTYALHTATFLSLSCVLLWVVENCFRKTTTDNNIN